MSYLIKLQTQTSNARYRKCEDACDEQRHILDMVDDHRCFLSDVIVTVVNDDIEHSSRLMMIAQAAESLNREPFSTAHDEPWLLQHQSGL